MKVFLHELKKLWNLKTTAAIFAFGALFFYLYIWSSIETIQMVKSGETGSRMIDFEIYGELLERYGTVIEPGEIIDFGIDAKIQEETDKAGSIIAADESGMFAKYGIYSFEQMGDWIVDLWAFEDFSAVMAVYEEMGEKLWIYQHIKERMKQTIRI
jgi:hypothetical protein